MSTKCMLIDAAHPEETRVASVTDSRLDDFDVETANRRQIKGNIYLAKVMRVEPSLQAAFVEYGGNRHGFLAFNEIHPDYYQIPVADREALIAESAAQHDGEDTESGGGESGGGENGEGEGPVEEVGGADDGMGGDTGATPARPYVKGRYKIQEVIKRRQILLIQVVKEERGTKGAALTTYISLAGRYCVLMPNTARGGGVSRKIGNALDRKRLKDVVTDLPIQDGMAVIVRTAGSSRTKAEIKRDFDYLIRLWGQIRDKTLESIAPALVHEEANLIKRAVRDLYTKDMEEIVVEGDEAYRSAKDFMKLLIPSHAKRVRPYKEPGKRLFQAYGIEGQLDAMYTPEAQLKSGGYIVINQTEALVSIDVNSGRSTRERNIEETALATNMEAAHEIARQLRLRDLAGLIVIDFIDMEINRNNVRVERALKDAMKSDRARIQIGRISPFGLLELSRQRLRSSLTETSTEVCKHCGGAGFVRTADSAALSLLRALEAECITHPGVALAVHAPLGVALYVLNHKRQALSELEQLYEVSLSVEADETLIAPAYRMDRTGANGETVTVTNAHARAQAQAHAQAQAQAQTQTKPRGGRGGEDARDEARDGDGGGRQRARRPRRGGRGGAPETRTDENAPAEAASDSGGAASGNSGASSGGERGGGGERGEGAETPGEEGERKRRRRGRRGGRHRRKDTQAPDTADAAGVDAGANTESGGDADGAPATAQPAAEPAPQPTVQPAADAKPAPRRRGRPRTVKPAAETDSGAGADSVAVADAGSDQPAAEAAEAKPRRARRRTAKPEAAADAGSDQPAAEVAEAQPAAEPAAEAKPAPRRVRRRKPAENPDSDSAQSAAAPQPVAAPQPAPEPEMNPEAAKTTVINVDEAKPAASRRGWWRRGA